MAKKIMMPTTSGGIMRYFNDYKSKLSLKPGYIIYFSLLMIIIVIALHIAR